MIRSRRKHSKKWATLLSDGTNGVPSTHKDSCSVIVFAVAAVVYLMLPGTPPRWWLSQLCHWYMGELVERQCCSRWYAWQANLWCRQIQFQRSRRALPTLDHATFLGTVLWSCLCCWLAHTMPCLLLGLSLYLLPHATQRKVVAPAQKYQRKQNRWKRSYCY